MHPHPLTAAHCSQNLQTERQRSAASPHTPSIPHHYCWAVVNSHNLSADAPAIRTKSTWLCSFFSSHRSQCKPVFSPFLYPKLSPVRLSFPIPSVHSLEMPLHVQPTLLYSPLPSQTFPHPCIHMNSEISMMLTTCSIIHIFHNMNLTSLRV